MHECEVYHGWRGMTMKGPPDRRKVQDGADGENVKPKAKGDTSAKSHWQFFIPTNTFPRWMSPLWKRGHDVADCWRKKQRPVKDIRRTNFEQGQVIQERKRELQVMQTIQKTKLQQLTVLDVYRSLRRKRSGMKLRFFTHLKENETPKPLKWWKDSKIPVIQYSRVSVLWVVESW